MDTQNEQIRIGQTWLVDMYIHGKTQIVESVVEKLCGEYVKLGCQWHRIGQTGAIFLHLLADAPAEAQPEAEPNRYPFNLEAALAGAKLVTRDGREVSGFQKRAPASPYPTHPYKAIFPAGQYYITSDGRLSSTPEEHRSDLFLAEPWPRQEAKPAAKLGDGWPWVPAEWQGYFRADHSGSVKQNWLDGSQYHQKLIDNFNVYRTESEAAARTKLDKRLAIHAALRQLGGGDEGDYVVRFWAGDTDWVARQTYHYAPGEARFPTVAAAKSALDVLLERGILKHGVAL